VSTVLGVAIPAQRKEHEWAEGVAIWIAVIIVNMVGSVNDYQKDQQFRKLNAQKEVFDVKVIRDGHQVRPMPPSWVPNASVQRDSATPSQQRRKVKPECPALSAAEVLCKATCQPQMCVGGETRIPQSPLETPLCLPHRIYPTAS
jgi:hypothetical protein